MATGVWFPRPRTVELRHEPATELGPADVGVRAVASAISHGTEMLVYRGEVPRELDLDLPTLAGSFGFPVKFGYASVGVVSEVGADVTEVGPGDLVFVHHPHQDRYRVSAAALVPLPADLDPERGVFFANTETALNIMLDAHPRSGDVVTVFGQGVVGLLVTQLLRRAGAHVVAIEPVELRALFERLHGEGIDSVLVEGGRGMITSVLRDGLVDRLMVCIAPKVLGAGIDAVGDLNIDRLRDAITFRSARFLPCGDDVIFDGEPERAAAAELRWSA